MKVEDVRKRFEIEAQKLERPNLDGEDLTSATVRAVKAQGIREALGAVLGNPLPTPSKDENAA